MISVMNNDFEFDRKSDAIQESEAKDRVSGASVDISNEKNYVNLRSAEARVSSIKLDSGTLESMVDDGVSKNGRSEADDGTLATEMESRVFDVEVESSGADQSEDRNYRLKVKLDPFEFQDDEDHRIVSPADRDVEREKVTMLQYKSLLSEFDDYVASEESGAICEAATSRALRYGLEVGDMVWGKVKSHPWWPGHIFNDAFVSPSVRRTRREGHVLVAFFGDSSYGWFDPAELIPFDSNFAEKSRQTYSRTFLKAVEEAVDEASRRRGLGLACKCRNPYNFRPTAVQGYFAVDVPEFEAGSFYSWNQIRKARESFKPDETLTFVKELALAPRDGDYLSINFINHRATIFGYRKAVFEEFDETYAQAFGMPGRPSRNAVAVLDQSVREPPRAGPATLSGPLVIAEALGGGKTPSKPLKVKDQSKKDRYLFKRRDEPSNSNNLQLSLGQASPSVPSSRVEGSLEVGAEEFVLQKRTLDVPTRLQVKPKHERTGFISKDGEAVSVDVSGNEMVTVERASVSDTTAQGGTRDTKEYGKVKGDPQKKEDRVGSEEVANPNITRHPDWSGEGDFTNVQRPDLSVSTKPEVNDLSDQVEDGLSNMDPSSAFPKRVGGMSSIGGVKKVKVLKRSATDMTLGNTVVGERKKKKRKEINSESNSDHVKKNALGKEGDLLGKLTGKSNYTGLAVKDDLQAEHQRRVGATVSWNQNIEFELPQLLSDLQALALNPFHGIERNCLANVKEFFLRFRSLVYQKSLVSSQAPAAEMEAVDIHVAKRSAAVSASDTTSGEHVRDLPSSKPVKPLLRRDDPTKAGRKRLPSDRQEEIAAKRVKRIAELKSLTTEKKVSEKISEAQRVEGKESAVPVSLKSVKQYSTKKTEPSARTVDPMMLVLKFPPQTSLPSLAELKARFARFGPIDQSGLRVFWKSSTCRVVFLHKPDAQAAYKYAIGNNSLFGNVSVRYQLRDLGGTAPPAPESRDENISDTPRGVKDPPGLQRSASSLSSQPVPQQPTVQLKSCLKKSTGDELGQVTTGGGGSSKATPRVKFMLGGEESSNRNNFNNNASFSDGGAPSSSSSSVAMVINSTNFQKVIPPPSQLPPILPLPQFAKPLHINANLHHSEIAQSTVPPPPPNVTNIDISQQMLSLLTRCNDIVNNVTGLLGYVPYHPL